MKFNILIDIELSANSRVLAEKEAKRIYGGVDDLVAEQNDPKNTTISLSLVNGADRQVIRTITSERVK